MKSVKIQQELIKNYASYVNYVKTHEHHLNADGILPTCYSIANGKVYLGYSTHIFAINENDILVDLNKFTEIENFRRDDIITKYRMNTATKPNSIFSGIIREVDWHGKRRQVVELRDISCSMVMAYVDKKIFDYFECDEFYMADTYTPIYAIKNGSCVGMMLPLSINEEDCNDYCSRF
jgi:hypothetical protein